MKITSTQLRGLNACEEQVELFEELFGQEVEVTLDVCLQNVSRFNFDWAAEKMLTPAAGAEYERVRATASAEYERVKATAWAEYKRVIAKAFYQGLSD